MQAWWRGYLLRKRYIAIRNKRAVNCTDDQVAASSEKRSERMQPIINRVMNAMKNLNSKHLYTRYKATEVLRWFYLFRGIEYYPVSCDFIKYGFILHTTCQH